jgi:hypothetical protein
MEETVFPQIKPSTSRIWSSTLSVGLIAAFTPNATPDAIAWTPGGHLLTANEGDYDVDLADGEFSGGRDFTVFAATGKVLFELVHRSEG